MKLLKNANKIIILVILAAGLFMTPFWLHLPSDTYMWREIHNSGHTPLFGFMALIGLALSRQILKNRLIYEFGHYAVAGILALTAGLVVELIQIYLPGDADIGDFMRDVGGVISFLGLYALIDKRLKTSGELFRIRWKIVVAVVTILALAGSATPILRLIRAYHVRAGIFPAIISFESNWPDKFVKTNRADLDKSEPPSDWLEAPPWVGELELFAGPYPGFSIDETFPNWDGFDSLCFTVFSDLDTSLTMTVRVDDKAHNHSFDDRYNGNLRIDKGVNKISIPLEEIFRAPAGRKMDSSNIRAIYVFAGKNPRKLKLWIGDMYLAKSREQRSADSPK